MSNTYQQILLEMYSKYPELSMDIWINIIQKVKLQEKNIFKKINKRSYYNYRLNIIFTFWADSHLKSRERYWRFVKFKRFV